MSQQVGEDSTCDVRPAGKLTGFDGIACRGARAMLGMSQVELCVAAQCGRNLLNDFENGLKLPRLEKIEGIKTALEDAGAIFIEDAENGMAVRVDRDRAAGRTPRARTIGGSR